MPITSDLACERKRADSEIAGISFTEEQRGNFSVETLLVFSEEGARALGRKQGKYVTVIHPPPWEMPLRMQRELTGLIRNLLLDFFPAPVPILAVGLGNPHLTSDALGWTVAEKIRPTRRMLSASPELIPCMGDISVFRPGVPSQTGISTFLSVKAQVAAVRPRGVILFDALKAGSLERVFQTVQLADTGLTPGSGLGEKGGELSRETLGVPTLSVGVPTVISGETLRGEFGATEKKNVLVAPRECDCGIMMMGEIISSAVNSAFGWEEGR